MKAFLKKRKYWILTLVLLIALLEFARYKTGEVIDSYLLEMVPEKSNGLYHLKYDKLTLNLLNGKIHLKGLVLELDHEKMETLKDQQEMFYELVVDEATINFEKVWTIYTEGDLHIEQIVIDKPVVQIIHMAQKESGLSKGSGDLYLFIADILHEFSIEELKVDNAALEYQERYADGLSVLKMPDLSFSLEGVLIDSTSATNENKIFYTDDLHIQIKDQVFDLADSIHQLAFSNLDLNTQTSEIRIENIDMGPKPGIDLQKVSKTHNIYQNKTELIQLSGADLKRAYAENILHIDKVQIERPKYAGMNKVIGKAHKDSLKPSNTVAELMLTVFTELHVDTFQIVNGTMDLELLKGEKMSVDDVDVMLSTFRLDSNTLKDFAWQVDYQDIEFRIRGERLFSNENGEIELKEFRLSSKDSILELQSVAVSSELFEEFEKITMSKVAFVGLDVPLLIEDRLLQADTFVMVRPGIDMVELSSNGRSGNDQSSSDLYEIVSPYLSAVDLDHVFIDSGFVHAKMGDARYSIEEFDVHLECMYIDQYSSHEEELFFSETASFTLNDVSIGDPDLGHDVVAGKITLNGIKKFVDVHGLRIRPDPRSTRTKSNAYHLDLPRLRVSSFDLKKVLFDRSYLFGVMRVKGPRLKIVQNEGSRNSGASSNSEEEHINALGIRKLILSDLDLELIKNDEVQFSAKEVYTNAQGFEVDPASLASGRLIMKFDSLEYGTSALSALVSDGKERITTGKVHVDIAASKGRIEHFHFVPLGQLDDYVEVHIPLVTSTGFEPYLGQYSRDLDLGKLMVHDPELTIHSSGKHSKKDPSAPFELPERLPPAGLFGLFDTLQSSTLAVHDARVEYLTKGSHPVDLEIREADVRFTDLFVSTKSSFKSGRQLWAKHLKVDMNGLRAELPDQKVDLRDLKFDTKARTLRMNDLNYHKGSEKDTVEVDVQLAILLIEGLQLQELILDKELRASSIVINKPRSKFRRSFEREIERERNEIDRIVKGNAKEHIAELEDLGLKTPNKAQVEEKTGPLVPLQLDISNSGFAAIAIKELRVSDGDLWVQWELEKEREASEIKGFDLQVSGINATDAFRATRGNPLFVSSLKVDMDRVQHPINNGMDMLKAGPVSIDLSNGNASLMDLSLHPTMNRNKYGKMKGRQVDILDVDNADLTITGIDVFEFLHSDGMKMDQVSVANARINIFKDKRLPIAIKVKPIPSTSILNNERVIDVGHIELKNSYLKYEEISEESSEPGEVFLTDLNATIENATNISSKIMADRELKVRASGELMNAAYVELDMDLDMHFANQGLFSAEARIGPFDLKTLNPFVAPHSFVSFRSGRADTIVMRMVADNDFAIGEMGFFYNNLKVDVLKPDAPEKSGRLFGGLVANAVIKTSNQYKGNSRTHPVYFERDKTRSVINYTVKSLLSGLISTISPAGYKSKIKKIEDPILLEKMRQKGISTDKHVIDPEEE